MVYGKGGSKQTHGCGSAPDFAKSTGFPKGVKQLGGTAASRAPNSGQTKMPADQGGRTESKS